MRSGPALAARQAAPDPGLLLIIASAIAFGLRPLFARWALGDGMPPVQVGLLLIGPTALVSAPAGLIWLWSRRAAPGAWSDAAWGLGAGALVAIGSVAYFRALEGLPVATVTLIYFSYPLFVIMLGRLILGVRLDPRSSAAAGLILLGCGLIVRPGLWPGGGESALLALSFLAALAYALLLLLLATRLLALPLLPRIGLISLGASLMLLAGLVLDGDAPAWQLGAEGWIGALGLIVLCGMLPQLMTTLGTALAGAQRAAIAGAFELVTAVLSGWIMLGEPAALPEIAGTVIIVSAVLLVQRSRRA